MGPRLRGGDGPRGSSLLSAVCFLLSFFLSIFPAGKVASFKRVPACTARLSRQSHAALWLSLAALSGRGTLRVALEA